VRGRLVLLALVVGLPLLAYWNQHRVDGHERMLGEVASEIAGRPVGVRCQGLPSALIDITNLAGEVQFAHDGTPADVATLKRDVCRDLKRFGSARLAPSFDCVLRVEPCERATGKVAYAVHVFTHEAWHLRGIANEAAAECYALQTTAQTAARLGATPEQARAIALWNLKHAYPHLPSQYHSSDCRDGGPLDLRPETSVWP
jgi:hypothetical protein